MGLEVNKPFIEELEQTLSSLSKTERVVGNVILKIVKSDRYEQYRHTERLKKVVASVETDSHKKLGIMVELTRKLLGEEQAKLIEYIISHATEYPYSQGYLRRPFRTKRIDRHFDKIFDKWTSLLCLSAYQYSVKQLLTLNDYDYMFEVTSDIIAFQLDHDNKEVVDTIKEMIYGDNNTALLTRDCIKAIFTSHRADVQQMLVDLLVAARLQEGLRQSIVETMDESALEGFVSVLKVIIDHNFSRYSSIVRAFDVWTGLGFEAANTRVVNQCIHYAYECLVNEETRKQWSQSEDANKLYMSLWATAVIEEEQLPPLIYDIMGNGRTYQKIVALYMLTQSQDDMLKYKIASSYLNETDQELLTLVINNYSYGSFYSWNYNARTGQSTSKLEIDRIEELEDKTERLRQYALLTEHLKNAPQKEVTFSSKVFDWVVYSYSSELIVQKIFYLIGYDMDPTLIADVIKAKEKLNSESRGQLIDLFITDDANPIQREFIFASLSDKSLSNREKALTKLLNMKLAPNEIGKVEAILKLKSGNLRQGAIKLLLKLDEANLEKTIDHLLQSKTEGQRLGALELLTEVKEAGTSNIRLEEKWKVISNPTQKEQVLIEKLTRSDEASSTSGLGLYVPTKEHQHRITKSDEEKDFKVLFSFSPERIKYLLQGLSNLIHKNREYQYEVEYFDGYKQTYLVGNHLTMFHYDNEDTDRANMEFLPLSDVWTNYFINEKSTEKDLIDIALCYQLDKVYRYYHNKLNYWEAHQIKKANDDRKKFLVGIFPFEQLQQFFQFVEELDYHQQVETIVMTAFRDLPKKVVFDFAYGRLQTMVFALPEERREKESFLYQFLVEPWVEWTMMNVHSDESFKAYFTQAYWLYHLTSYTQYGPSTEEAYRAYSLKLIDENELVKELVSRENSDSHIRDMTSPRVEFIKKHPSFKPLLDKIIPTIVEIEIARGDLPTAVTKLATEIEFYEGMNYFIDILASLDKETFVRGYIYSYGDNITKKETLSHLLKVCHPKDEDTAEQLQVLIREKNISEKRVLEAAMYAPQWLDLVANTLQWEGLRKAAWYFHAHINEHFSAEKETIVAHYSPISPEQFNDGAFDIQWFKEAYNQIGEERFTILYDCAKYISGGANHRRAQLFADATLGKITTQDMKESVHTKRNKDHLLCYSLIPINESNPKDVLERYEFIQQFLKESKKFGSQRRASEAKVVDIALDNLARNAGYSDVTRLRWDMEAQKMNEIMPYFEPKEIDDLTVHLSIAENGKSEIIVYKNKKQLKSIPAKYKKHDYLLALKEVNQSLKEQFARARVEFERSMETESAFTLQEVENIMSNPVLAPLLGTLVMKSDNDLGFYRDRKLHGPTQESYMLSDDAELIVAHPVHLYESGRWSEFQKFLFDNQIKQPFKQVFREYYRPNADELGEGTVSRRYAGHQVQPRKAVALLKNRMWTVSYEEGLQKVDYKNNIIAKIYALADWFSPSDVESPMLETVEFLDRHTYKRIDVSKIPSILFSETMRDVDLVVSVAHVGGVDPEASLTTMEMRATIVEETIRLMKLSNVRVEGKFALISGTLGEYSVHLGSAQVAQQANGMIHILPVHSQHRGRIFLPFLDEDPRTAEIISKIMLLANDTKIKDPHILEQIKK
ncbi:DUF4132 domain-containing protein [Bacillus alkalicellulosilyticus]|uniref:DUF4132 domain-containing protein n=1 Tax=Alkalihalobacterium alkalicellulosilyticum TaxID=1912214 RepID=UPI0009977EAA|nr:DUF4132 domain-containing protein [Bacillus alkalicellulosilyticus]